MNRASSRGRRCLVLVVLALWAGAAPGAQRPSPLEGAKTMLGEQLSQLEAEIARLMMQRRALSGDDLVKLEMRIDLRILCRAILNQAMAATAGSDAQATGRLRAQLCLAAMTTLENAMYAQKDALTHSQRAALDKLRELTVELEKMKGGREMDDACHRLGLIVLELAGPPGLTQKNIQPVRPKPLGSGTDSPASEDGPDAGKLAQELQSLTVSVPLREQLLALASAASQPRTGDANKDREAGLMLKMLEEAVAVARGLAGNVGVATDARLKMEQELAEGIALYLDPRTRAAGTTKIASLATYGQFLARIGRMNLSREQDGRFRPLFQWAWANPAYREKVLAAVEKYQAAHQRYANRGQLPTTMPAARRAYDELERQFAVAGNAFLVAAAAAPRPGPTTRPLGDMERRAEEMTRAIDLLEKVQRLPGTIDLLCAFAPRNPAALERRLWQAAMNASSPVDTQIKRDGAKLIDDIDALARAVRGMPKMSQSQVPAALDQRWTGGRLTAIDARWKETVTDIANSVALGQAVNGRKMARLPAAAELYQSLLEAAGMDLLLSQSAPAISRWVDWRLSGEDLKALLAPYPQAMADAYAGFLAETAGWEDKWAKAQQTYAPVIAEIVRVCAYREQCQFFPGGMHWLASALLTPMEGAPFARERWVAYAVWVWKWHRQNGQNAAADAVLAELVKKLKE